MKFFEMWKTKSELIAERDKARAMLHEEVSCHEKTKKDFGKTKQALAGISDHRSELLIDLRNSRNEEAIMAQLASEQKNRADKAEKVVALLNAQLTQRVGHLYKIGEMILNQKPYHQILQQLTDWAIPVAASGGVVSSPSMTEEERIAAVATLIERLNEMAGGQSG